MKRILTTLVFGLALVATAFATYERAQGGLLPAKTNALAPRGGLVWDGTAGGNITSTLTSQNLGTDAFSVTFTLKVPSSVSTAAYIFGLTSSSSSVNQADSFSANFEAANGGTFRVTLRGNPTTNYVLNDYHNVFTNYAGKELAIAVVRDTSGDPKVYFNGVLQTKSATLTNGTPPSWQATIASTYALIGRFDATNYPFNSTLRHWSLYNTALGASDVQEIYELGGAVPYRFQFGSQAERLANNSFTSGLTSWSTAGTATIAADSTADAFDGNSAKITTDGTTYGQVFQNVAATRGKQWRIRFRAKTTLSGKYVEVTDRTTVIQNVNVTTSWAQYEVTALWTATGANSGAIAFGTNFQNVGSLYLDDLSAVQIGAVVHLPFTEGAGTTAYDQSTNALNATLTSTGVTWANPAGHFIGFGTDTNLFRSGANKLRTQMLSNTGAVFFEAQGGVSGQHIAVFGHNASNGTADFGTSTNTQMRLVTNGTTAVSIDTSQNAAFAGRVRLVDGSNGAPAFSFTSDSDTGFYRIGSGEVVYTADGVRSVAFGTGGTIYGATSNTLTMGASGSIGLAAAGTNQNITLTPSGTGKVYVDGRFSTNQNTTLPASSGVTTGISLGFDTNTEHGWIQSSRNSSAEPRVFQINPLGGSVLVGTTTDSSNGRIQLASHTTSAGGIGFGTDTSLFRTGTGLRLQATYQGAGSNLIALKNGSSEAMVSGGVQMGGIDFRYKNDGFSAGGDFETADGDLVAAIRPISQPWTGWNSDEGNTSLAFYTARNNGGTALAFSEWMRITAHGLITFGGGASASFPALKRSGTSLAVTLADDSDFTSLTAKSVVIANGDTTLTRVTTATLGVPKLQINGTSTVSGVRTATATLDFASIPAHSDAGLTVTVTGAAVGDVVSLGPPAGLEAGLTAMGRVSSADTVTIRLSNITTGAIDPASATWRVMVTSF